jgi:2-oxoglutarate ferredoxin oxidoreductase subunit alpha
MVKLRQEKVDRIADYIPLQTLDNGNEKGKLLILGWGSTYGSIKTAVRDAIAEGLDVSHAHVKYLNPFPKNLGDMLKNFDKVLIPEINNGQLIKVIRDKYFIDAKGLNKIKGMPFSSEEIKEKIKEMLK